MVGIGFDFGTSNSAVATFDGRTVSAVPLEPDRSPPSVVMPSAVHVDRRFRITTGWGAIERYLEDNVGRVVELVPEVVGTAELYVGGGGENSRAAPETLSQDMHSGALVDLSSPGRLFRGVKRLLGDPDTERLDVFDRAYRLVALLTPLLARMRSAVGAPGVRVCLGHPVHFEGRHPRADEVALHRLREACGYAGLAVAAQCPEPVAATLSFLQGTALHRGHVLAFDFGGGTLDVCVVAVGAGRQDVLATHGVSLGGDHIDQRLFRHLLFPHLGQGASWTRVGDAGEITSPFPFERYEPLLLNWTVSYLLNQGRFVRPVIQGIEAGGLAAPRFRRLLDLIRLNQCFLVFERLRALKEALSERDTAVVDLPELDLELRFTRGEFEALIEDLLEEVDRCVGTVLSAAGLRDRDVDAVVRTGGSSQIPAVERLLERRFPGRVRGHDVFTSVAGGLAIADHLARQGGDRP